MIGAMPASPNPPAARLWTDPCGRRLAGPLLPGRHLLVCAFLLPALLLATTAQPPRSSGDLTGSWHLFVDDSLIEHKEHVQRTLHPFIKAGPRPVLSADRPWEGRLAYLYGTVLPGDGGGYRMWYHTWAGEYRCLFADSADGLRWTKPPLGLVEFQGSRANNIFVRRTREDHLPQIIHTPWEPSPAQRYKLLNYDYGRSGPEHSVSGFWGATSPDGVHWTDLPQNPALKDPGDVGHFVWDAHRRRYIGFPKTFAPVRGFRRRCVGFTATTDFAHWPSAQLILAPDRDDDRWTTQPGQRTEFYGLCGFPYESAYLGFLWIFRVTDGHNDGPIYPELVSSRDGMHWTRPDAREGGRIPLIALGADGEWDRGMIFTPSQPVVAGDTIKLWYGGMDITHGGPDAEAHGAIGLATLRKDGFASLDAMHRAGVVTTKPLLHLRGALHVNAQANDGVLRVEVLTADGKVVPGYDQASCHALCSDGVDQVVTWNARRELPRSAQPLRLRFHLVHASLYSFAAGPRVRPAANDPEILAALNFEEPASAPPSLQTRIEHLASTNGEPEVPYVLSIPTARAHPLSPLLIYLYGAGGSHEDYNLQRPPYDRLRTGLAALGYYILIPELGPLHWMNPTARQRLDRILDQVLANHPIDPRRLQIMGTSMGGGSALAYAIQRPDRVRSVCSHMGMTDFAQWIQERPSYWGTITQAFGGSPTEVPDHYRSASAIANPDSFARIPVFQIAGAEDQTVLPSQGRHLADALARKGYDSIYREAKNLAHEDRTITEFSDELLEFLRRTADLPDVQPLETTAAIARPAGAQAAFGSGVLNLEESLPAHPHTLLLRGTAQLGRRFTLAAQVRTSNHQRMRVFSNYRGTGEPVSGELIFDLDRRKGEAPTLRLVVNGQCLQSAPLHWQDQRYQHVAVTYDDGHVVFYFEGKPAGAGQVPLGTTHLRHDRTVQPYFERPTALPEVGVQLADDLRLGADLGDPFVTYEDRAVPSDVGQWVGAMDDVLVARRAWTPGEVRRLSQKGLDLCQFKK